MNRLLLHLSILALLASDAAALQVGESFVLRVRVVSETGEPIRDAHVELLNSRDRIVARAFAGDSGLARLTVPAPGEYSFNVQRFGYEPWTSPLMPFTADAAPAIELRIRVRPVQLTDIVVPTDGRCTPDPPPLLAKGLVSIGRAFGRLIGIRAPPQSESERGALMVRAHEHATRTLRSVVEARPADGTYTMRSISKRPRFSSLTDSVLERIDTTYVRVAVPLSAPPAQWLAQNGYIQPRRSREELPKYYAPVPEVLLSDAFARTHCFRGVPHADSAWIGLAFEPMKGVTTTDVRGVVWVDTVRSRTVRIEYHYSRYAEFLDQHERRYAHRPGEAEQELKRAVEREKLGMTERVTGPSYRYFAPDPKEDEFGGVLDFGVVDNRWDIARWEIRWAALRFRPRFDFSFPNPREGVVNGRAMVRRFAVNITFLVLGYWDVGEVLSSASPGSPNVTPQPTVKS